MLTLFEDNRRRTGADRRLIGSGRAKNAHSGTDTRPDVVRAGNRHSCVRSLVFGSIESGGGFGNRTGQGNADDESQHFHKIPHNRSLTRHAPAQTGRSDPEKYFPLRFVAPVR